MAGQRTDKSTVMWEGDLPQQAIVEVKTVLTAQKCRRHPAECQRLAEQTGNARVKGILLDMARTWDQAGSGGGTVEPGKLTTSFRAPERHISQPPADGFVGSKGCVICLGVQERPKEYLHFTAEPVDRGARKAGKRRKFERGLINNFALLLRQLLRLSVERASVSAFLSQHVAGYVLKSLSCWATRATSRCSLNTLLLRLLRFE